MTTVTLTLTETQARALRQALLEAAASWQGFVTDAQDYPVEMQEDLEGIRQIADKLAEHDPVLKGMLEQGGL